MPPIDGLHDIWPSVSTLWVSSSVRRPLRALASASETATRSCEEEISRLPTKAPGKSADFEGGLESVQREVLSLLTDLKEESRLNHPDNFSRKQAKALMVFEQLAKSAQN